MTDLKWYHYPEIHAQFQQNTTTHEMHVLHEHDLYRHLRFRSPDSMMWYFDLVTWPGSLAFKGDIGDGYIFSRAPDMLTFFDTGQPAGHINPGYWAEKLARGARDVKEFSTDRFQSWVQTAMSDLLYWRAITPEMEGIEHAAKRVESVNEAVETLEYFGIDWDGDTPEAWLDYQHHFILSLHAILWGAKTYHKQKADR